MSSEPLLRKSQADQALEHAALELRRLLREACADLRPFPSFPDALFTNAIECEAAGVAPGIGCVVVCEDGELYELEFGVDHHSMELTGLDDPLTSRRETVRRLDLHPRDYIAYAYSGLLAVTEQLLDRRVDAGAAG